MHTVFMAKLSLLLMAAPMAGAAPLPNISSTFTVHTIERDDESNTTIAKQTVARDTHLKRQYMVADGALAHGHLEEAMRCDLHPMGYALAMHGAEGSAPSTWQCTNDTIAPDLCTFGDFWALPSNATWDARVQYNASLVANRFVWWEEGEEHEFIATVDGATPLRIARVTAIPPHRRYHIDWIGFTAASPPLSAFTPPAGLPKCPPSKGAASDHWSSPKETASLTLLGMLRARAPRS